MLHYAILCISPLTPFRFFAPTPAYAQTFLKSFCDRRQNRKNAPIRDRLPIKAVGRKISGQRTNRRSYAPLFFQKAYKIRRKSGSAARRFRQKAQNQTACRQPILARAV